MTQNKTPITEQPVESTEEIERVAKALFNNNVHTVHEGFFTRRITWEELAEGGKEHLRNDAKSAIAAMSPKRESGYLPMETAPKDRAILLLIETCWLPLPWVGNWSYDREDWNVYLPFKIGEKNATTYGFVPMGWMEIPKRNEIEGGES